MVTLLNVCPATIDLCITRGDTTPWTYTVKDAAGVVVDITGFTYLLTVDPSDEPADAVNNLFQLTGTVPVGTDGVVQFGLSLVQSDQTPDQYFYDVQQTDTAAKIRTIVVGGFEFKQDLTK